MSNVHPLAYNLSEAAEALHVSRPTMQTLVNRADFPSFQVGRRWIIPADGLKRWLEDQAKMSCEAKATGMTIKH